jgi:hypothetical protein
MAKGAIHLAIEPGILKVERCLHGARSGTNEIWARKPRRDGAEGLRFSSN